MRGVLGDVEFAFSAGAGRCSSDLGTFAALVCPVLLFMRKLLLAVGHATETQLLEERGDSLDHVTSSCECIERVRLRDVVGIRIPDERAGV